MGDPANEYLRKVSMVQQCIQYSVGLPPLHGGIFVASILCRISNADATRNNFLLGGREAMIIKDTEKKTTECIDAMIIAIAEKQDRTAFKNIFEHFAPKLKGFLLRQGTDIQIVEEIIQETMVNVWKKARLFDPRKASAATWIFTISRNQRIDQLRKFMRPEPDMNDPAFIPDTEIAADDAIIKSERNKRLLAVISALSSEQQQVLKLAFFEEKPHPQIATELGIPLGTVKSRIRLAMKRMRSELGEQQ